MIHFFDTEDAKRYGILEAIIISNFKFWITQNKANRKNYHDGRTWTYNSIQALTELFPYASIGQVRRAIERLVESGVLAKGCYNETPYDRTAWYAFADENEHIDLANLTNVDLANSTNVYKETDSKQQIENKSAGRPATRARKKSENILLAEWSDKVIQSGEKLIPADDTIFDDGIPKPFLHLAWKSFAEDMETKAKKAKDWRAQFRTYVRKDYLKLWAMNREGQYYLTTAGKQAAIRFGMEDLLSE